MKHTMMLMSILAIAACGGKKPEPEQPKEPEADPAPAADETKTKAKAAPDAEPDTAPAPPPPKSWHAKADLTPVKGAKLKGATVTFAQKDGEPVTVGSTGWFDGIKSGKYHLVVHEGSECGAKAGKPIATADMPFIAAKGMDSVDVGQVTSIQLDGDGAIVGHALVLHDDKKGKIGKPLACGPIASAEE